MSSSKPSQNDKTLLKGRLTETIDEFVVQFTASIGFDYRLAEHDLLGSMAHVRMLHKVGVLSADERKAILSGLEQIQSEVLSSQFNWSVSLEDVHMNIEHRLIDLVGAVGQKLHTGRSRNDQVATSMRLYLRSEIDALMARLFDLAESLFVLAEKHVDTLMAGFTHLQVAQPVTFGHHMMAWAAMLERDIERLMDCRSRVNRLPLGAAALAGTSFPIDRQMVADELGFAELAGNSLDAVSDRDFAIEFCAFGSILLMHFSRWSEELIIWSSAQFKFIDLPDRFCTGSSIMPQKKNPDVPELIRGKSGRMFGHLIGLLTLMKGQPLAYNKDNQEDKEPLFDAVDTLHHCTRAFVDMLPAMTVDKAELLASIKDFATATDLADYLSSKGVPFRVAHEQVGALVKAASAEGRDLADLSIAQLKEVNPLIESDVFPLLTPEGSVQSRSHTGGTAPSAVKQAVKDARKRISQLTEAQKIVSKSASLSVLGGK